MFIVRCVACSAFKQGSKTNHTISDFPKLGSIQKSNHDKFELRQLCPSTGKKDLKKHLRVSWATGAPKMIAFPQPHVIGSWMFLVFMHISAFTGQCHPFSAIWLTRSLMMVQNWRSDLNKVYNMQVLKKTNQASVMIIIKHLSSLSMVHIPRILRSKRWLRSRSWSEMKSIWSIHGSIHSSWFIYWFAKVNHDQTVIYQDQSMVEAWLAVVGHYEHLLFQYCHFNNESLSTNDSLTIITHRYSALLATKLSMANEN